MKLFLALAALIAVASAESWSGQGFARCYGEINIMAARPDWEDVNGIAQCRPKAWNGASDPQAIFITGEDGTEYSIFVFGEATAQADCEGQITYTYGNLADLTYCGNKSYKSMEKLGKNISLNPRTQCGYFQCFGMINLECEGACPQ